MNEVLFHWKKVSSQKCDWCNEKQTMVHVMTQCQMTRK